MTDHIISFSIGIDDDAIIRSVQENADKQIILDIKNEILHKIFSPRYYGDSIFDGYKKKVDKNAELSTVAQNIIKETIADYKDEIIERASQLLADSYKRTKAWKEKAGEVTE